MALQRRWVGPILARRDLHRKGERQFSDFGPRISQVVGAEARGVRPDRRRSAAPVCCRIRRDRRAKHLDISVSRCFRVVADVADDVKVIEFECRIAHHMPSHGERISDNTSD